MDVHFFDMELRTGTGLLLSKRRMSVEYDGKPILVAAGMFFDMVWDIQIQNIDPAIVKALVPNAHGLTSRLQDRDTKEITMHGNMKLNTKAKGRVHLVRRGEAVSRDDTTQRAVKATKNAGGR